MYADKIDKVYKVFLDWTMSLEPLIDTKTSVIDEMTMNLEMTEYHFGLRVVLLEDMTIKEIDKLRNELIAKLDIELPSEYRLKLDFSVGSSDRTLKVLIVYKGTEPLAFIVHDKDSIYKVFLDRAEAEKFKSKDQRVRALWESDFKEFLWDFKKTTSEVLKEHRLAKIAKEVLNAKIPKDK